ncbi:MAG: PTS lactose/cellobiose transporter subunit IIA [Lachnospirales bacterium]
MMDGVELICFQIISSVGAARSSYIEAIQKAKAGDFKEAAVLMNTGEQEFLKGYAAHSELIQKEAAGTPVANSLILVHAEDQVMSAEEFRIIASELIDSYKRIAGLERRLEQETAQKKEQYDL